MKSENLSTGINPVSMLLSRGLIAFDMEGGAASAPAGSGAPAPAAPAPTASVSDASKAYLAGLSAEQKAAPLAMPAEPTDNIDDDGGDQFEADGVATPDSVEVPAVPAAAPAEHVIAREDGATWNESSRRWQQADGTFVDGEAPTAAELEALTTARAAAATAAEQQAAATAKKKVTLTGLEEKGEAPLEIELDDEVAAERIRRLQNDGLRRKAYQEMKGKVDEERAELTAVTSAIEADPVSFVVGSMTPERQLEVARALLAEHFDKLIPDIQQYDDDARGAQARADARLALRDRVDGSREAMTESRARQQHAAACMNAAQALIPDHVDSATAAEFLRDVEIDLVHAARLKQTVSPETVPQLIDRRLKLYGFGAGAAAAPPAVPAPAAAPRADAAPPSDIARPVGAKTQAIAARVVTKDAAKAAQNRIRQVQATRQTAAAVAPPGAGAAPVQVPVIPPTADIREASKVIRKQGNAGWAG